MRRVFRLTPLVAARIHQILAADRAAQKKQRRTATRIHPFAPVLQQIGSLRPFADQRRPDDDALPVRIEGEEELLQEAHMRVRRSAGRAGAFALLDRRLRPPPDDVPAIGPDVRESKSIRKLLSKHRDSPNCYSCHQKIDPPGFALKNFDPIGGWRAKYGKTPIDPSGELPGGGKFDDVAGFKKLLVKQYRARFAHNLTERLLTYAIGRRMEALDPPGVEKIVIAFPNHQHGLRSLIEDVVASELFLRR
jgi:hypothetical protein